jgi:hypothetical protein
MSPASRPGHHDGLEDLYDEVWASYTHEPPPLRALTAERDLAKIYSVYGEDTDLKPPSSSTSLPVNCTYSMLTVAHSEAE